MLNIVCELSNVHGAPGPGSGHGDIGSRAIHLEHQQEQGTARNALRICKLAGGHEACGIAADDSLTTLLAQTHPVTAVATLHVRQLAMVDSAVAMDHVEQKRSHPFF